MRKVAAPVWFCSSISTTDEAGVKPSEWLATATVSAVVVAVILSVGLSSFLGFGGSWCQPRRPADALASSQDAVAIYRHLATDNPDLHNPNLATALGNQAFIFLDNKKGAGCHQVPYRIPGDLRTSGPPESSTLA